MLSLFINVEAATLPLSQAKSPSPFPSLPFGSKPQWKPALPHGVLPAYDEALKLIFKDAKRLRAEARQVQQKIAGLENENEEEKKKEGKKNSIKVYTYY